MCRACRSHARVLQTYSEGLALHQGPELPSLQGTDTPGPCSIHCVQLQLLLWVIKLLRGFKIVTISFIYINVSYRRAHIPAWKSGTASGWEELHGAKGWLHFQTWCKPKPSAATLQIASSAQFLWLLQHFPAFCLDSREPSSSSFSGMLYPKATHQGQEVLPNSPAAALCSLAGRKAMTSYDNDVARSQGRFFVLNNIT